jgi:hypothetical protein
MDNPSIAAHHRVMQAAATWRWAADFMEYVTLITPEAGATFCWNHKPGITVTSYERLQTFPKLSRVTAGIPQEVRDGWNW